MEQTDRGFPIRLAIVGRRSLARPDAARRGRPCARVVADGGGAAASPDWGPRTRAPAVSVAWRSPLTGEGWLARKDSNLQSPDPEVRTTAVLRRPTASVHAYGVGADSTIGRCRTGEDDCVATPWLHSRSRLPSPMPGVSMDRRRLVAGASKAVIASGPLDTPGAHLVKRRAPQRIWPGQAESSS